MKTEFKHIFIPGDLRLPVLLLLHGTGGNERDLLDLGQSLSPGAAILSPRGKILENGMPRFFKRLAEGVFDLEDLAFRTNELSDFVVEARGEYELGDTPIFALGYSNGANILAAVQFAAPELFDATILMHPLIPFTPPAVDFGGRKVLITAGQRDPMASVAMTETLGDYFTAHGAKTELAWHAGGHELRQEELRAAQAFLAG